MAISPPGFQRVHAQAWLQYLHYEASTAEKKNTLGKTFLTYILRFSINIKKNTL